jgi:hypothetical protein
MIMQKHYAARAMGVNEMEGKTTTHSFEIEVIDHHTREKKQVFIDDVPVGIDIQELAEILQESLRREINRWKKRREPKPRD